MRSHRSTIVGVSALIVLLSAGAAQSLPDSNTVFGDDIVDGTITTPDLKAGSISGSRLLDNGVTGSKIFNNSVTGADVNESTLNLKVPTTPLTMADPTACESATLGEPARYWRDAAGVVHLQGTVLATGEFTCGGLIATLPAGNRPAGILRFPINTYSGNGLVAQIESDGDIQVMEGDSQTAALTTNIDLSGITFLVKP